jgi:Tol biopolymer transport system component
MNTLLKFSITLTGCLFLVQCRTPDVQSAAQKPKVPKGFVALMTEPLVNTGNSEGGSYSSDGKKVIFISSDRAQHKSRQAYETRFDTKKERRLTFQDGEVVNAVYAIDGNSFYYASSTDEIKEDPDFIRDYRVQSGNAPKNGDVDFNGRPLARSEIYFSNREGSSIQRLSKSPGFDGHLSLTADGKTLYFASRRSGSFKVYVARPPTSSAVPLGRSSQSEFYVSQSPKWTVASVGSDDMKKTQLEISKSGFKPVAITKMNNNSIQPSFHFGGDWIIFSSNSEDVFNYELYLVRRDGECLTRLTYTVENEFEPQFNPKSTTGEFIYSLQLAAQSSIMLVKEFKLPECTVEMKKEFK